MPELDATTRIGAPTGLLFKERDRRRGLPANDTVYFESLFIATLGPEAKQWAGPQVVTVDDVRGNTVKCRLYGFIDGIDPAVRSYVTLVGSIDMIQDLRPVRTRFGPAEADGICVFILDGDGRDLPLLLE